MNRLNDLTDVKHVSGRVLLDGENILLPEVDVIALTAQGRDGVFPPGGAADDHPGEYHLRVGIGR